ncbi:MAG: GerMN domain-containing protein [Syntrophomonadaceae bacterium]|nr:GerMN domain-containing protein [Syntrophomonadaceae bacterium]
MGKKFIGALAVIILAACLLGGGCDDITEKQSIKTWRDLLNPVTGQTGDRAEAEKENKYAPPPAVTEAGETVEVKLFFYDADTKALKEEKKKIPKTESIARDTIGHLLAGLAGKDRAAVFPAGTELLDINIKKEDGLCVVDLSAEARNTEDPSQARQIVESVANTLGQFPAVKKVKILIAGQDIETIPEFSAVMPQLKSQLEFL